MNSPLSNHSYIGWHSLRSQHIDQEEYDAERTACLQQRGYRVLRFWNGDVMNNISGVMGAILEELRNS